MFLGVGDSLLGKRFGSGMPKQPLDGVEGQLIWMRSGSNGA
jgi:hypothetical protein